MKLGQGVEWSLHCCVILALIPPDQTLPASRLAEFHAVPPTYLAKHLQALAEAGIVESIAGRRGGYRLARPAKQISVLEIVEAVEGTGPAFQCDEIRRRGPAAVPARDYAPVCGIAAVMYRAEEAWKAELADESVADIVRHLGSTVSIRSAQKAAKWFQEVRR